MDNNELYVNEVIGAYLDTKEEMKDLEESLKRLEDIQSIMLERGCYHITETILN